MKSIANYHPSKGNGSSCFHNILSASHSHLHHTTECVTKCMTYICPSTWQTEGTISNMAYSIFDLNSGKYLNTDVGKEFRQKNSDHFHFMFNSCNWAEPYTMLYMKEFSKFFFFWKHFPAGKLESQHSGSSKAQGGTWGLEKSKREEVFSEGIKGKGVSRRVRTGLGCC